MKDTKLIYNKSFRANLRNSPKKALKELQSDVTDGVQVKYVVVTNTKDKTHIVFPSIKSGLDLNEISASGTSTASSAGTLATTSTYASCIGTLSTSSTLGCAGSVDAKEIPNL